MPSLWTPASWAERLAELEARGGEPGGAPTLKDLPLRRDIRSLGTLLGQVLREQAGTPLFDAVESLRRTARARRSALAVKNAGPETSPDARQGSTEAARGYLETAQALTRNAVADPTTAYKLARAFAFYFELINLAETNHRKRRRRSALLDANAAPQRGSLRGTLRRLREAGFSRAEALTLLAKVCIMPVFTAQPYRGRTPQRHVQAPPHLRSAGEAGHHSPAAC